MYHRIQISSAHKESHVLRGTCTDQEFYGDQSVYLQILPRVHSPGQMHAAVVCPHFQTAAPVQSINFFPNQCHRLKHQIWISNIKLCHSNTKKRARTEKSHLPKWSTVHVKTSDPSFTFDQSLCTQTNFWTKQAWLNAKIKQSNTTIEVRNSHHGNVISMMKLMIQTIVHLLHPQIF